MIHDIFNTAQLDSCYSEDCKRNDETLPTELTHVRTKSQQSLNSEQKFISAKTLIFEEGKKHDCIYTVCDGWGFIYKTVSNNGKRQILRFLLPGDLVGFQVNTKGLMNYSAMTITDFVVCVFPREQLKPLLKRQPEIAVRLLEIGSRDASLCQNHLMAAGRKTAKESIAFVLLEIFYRVMSQSPQDYTESTRTIDFPITQEDIGDAVGLTNIHVNRVIKELIKDNLILLRKRKLTILDDRKLSEIADFQPEMIAGLDLV